jgi:hypothetical protein
VRESPCNLSRAVGALAAHRKSTARALAVSLVPALVAAGCGGGATEDAKAPHGTFPVTVERAAFPADQQLARNSTLLITVRNSGARTVPNVNVTLKCGPGLAGSFETLSQNPDVADPRRPQFVLDTVPTRTSNNRPPLDTAPVERTSALVDTYPLGQLPPGRRVTFAWKVTAAMAGPYRVCYHVNADLYGDARAVPAAGSLPIRGSFTGTVSNAPPKACVAPDGMRVTTTGCR